MKVCIHQFWTIVILSVMAIVIAFLASPPPLVQKILQGELGSAKIKVVPITPACDQTLWNHTYAGDPRKFKVPQDRLKVIQDCSTVTGTLETAIKEADGDWHLRLRLDSQFQGMLNAKNTSGQRGDLVLEPVCENAITQADTLKEGSCDNYKGHVFDKSFLGKHVKVIGAYVTDMEHGWNELHPVTSINIE